MASVMRPKTFNNTYKFSQISVWIETKKIKSYPDGKIVRTAGWNQKQFYKQKSEEKY